MGDRDHHERSYGGGRDDERDRQGRGDDRYGYGGGDRGGYGGSSSSQQHQDYAAQYQAYYGQPPPPPYDAGGQQQPYGYPPASQQPPPPAYDPYGGGGSYGGGGDPYGGGGDRGYGGGRGGGYGGGGYDSRDSYGGGKGDSYGGGGKGYGGGRGGGGGKGDADGGGGGGSGEPLSEREIMSIIESRNNAKLTRDFDEADRLRAQLKSHGVEVDDKAKRWTCSDGRSGEVYSGGARGDKKNSDGSLSWENTIFVMGLPESASVDEIADFFGQIGTIKKSKKNYNMGEPTIHIYKDKRTGRPKGEATVSFEEVETAQAAIKFYNGAPFSDRGGPVHGSKLAVSIATRPAEVAGKGKGKGGGKGW